MTRSRIPAKLIGMISAGVLLLAITIGGAWWLFAGRPSEPVTASYLIEYGETLHSIYALDISHAASISPSMSEPPPQIELPVTFGNLGRVSYGDSIEKTFVVHNVGESPLTILNLYSTCTYVSAELTTSVISPGRAALLTVTLHADEYPDEMGTTIRRGVMLHSNDPRQPESTVWIQAHITR